MKTRGLRNNNPFNIRISDNKWKGKVPNEYNNDGAFEQFYDMEYGIRAALIIIDKYVRVYELRTAKDIISRWAPPSENETSVYVSSVENRLKVDEMTWGKPVSIVGWLYRLLNHMAAVESAWHQALPVIIKVDQKYEIFKGLENIPAPVSPISLQN